MKLIFILAKEPLKNHDGTFLYDPVGSAGLFKAGLRSPGLVRNLNSDMKAYKAISVDSFCLQFGDWML